MSAATALSRTGAAPYREVAMARPWFGPEEVAAVTAVVESGWVSQGERVVEFERAVANLVEVPHAVAVSNCTTALHLAMVVNGVFSGDEVVVPSLSFVATANAVRYVGAAPVFAEVDPQTHNVDASTVEAALTPRTRAVIVVHQCGVPADVEAIEALCAPRGIAGSRTPRARSAARPAACRSAAAVGSPPSPSTPARSW